jgi:hypothetical protein
MREQVDPGTERRARDREVARAAARQFGVASVEQLREAGLDASAIGRRAQGARLHRVHRGVYAVGHPALTRHGEWLAAVLACGPGAVLSHLTAAALWELRPERPGRIHVTVPSRAGRRGPAVVALHRPRRFPADDVTVHLGIPVTTPARTLLDACAGLPRHAVARTVEQAEIRGLLDLERLGAMLADARGRRGLAALRAQVARLGEPVVTRSDLEARFLALCDRQALPRPEVNARLGRFEVDVLWRRARLVVELDGRETHATRAAFERDRARDAELQVAGFRVVRFTYRQVVDDPAGVAATVRALLP